MVTLEKLPREVIMIIVHYPATSALFSSLWQSPTNQNQRKCFAMMRDVKAGRTSVFSYTKNFVLAIAGNLPQSTLKPWFAFWKVLIPAMPKLRTLQWRHTHNTQYPIAWVNNFVKILGTQSNLKHLAFTITSVPLPIDFSLEPLSALESIVIFWETGKETKPGLEPLVEERNTLISQLAALLGRCPDLKCFRFFAPSYERGSRAPITILRSLLGGLNSLSKPLRIQEIVVQNAIVDPEDIRLHLRHLHFLEELSIYSRSDLLTPSRFGEIYSLLREAEIHLKFLRLDSFQIPGVMECIASYRGLEQLSINSNDHLDDSPQILERFISSFHMHCRSLKFLGMNIRRESPWPCAIVKHLRSHADEYPVLRELQLRLCFTLHDVRDEKDQQLWDLLEAATRLRGLRRLECSFVEWRALRELSTDTSDDDLIEPEVYYDSQFYVFMQGIIEQFKQTHHPFFEIKLWR
ncbi:hypothetical protein NP233_g3632 [Leucocoprinus birnbaumii]|uniref:Uncharacterized protein n=1 Tax=Leucocoprinus birnbaumii TaxID=56174 RepID=A0AAD5VW58_9AGAR|nr:hypothetical protein NP233_g3632 [Leucocoprinus birnbaumii]